MTKLPRGVDGRSALARQYRQAVRDLAADFGGEDALTVAERELIEQAAIMIVRASTMRADILKGVAVDDTAATRLANASARLMQAVANQNRKRKQATPQSLEQYLAEPEDK